MLLLLALGVAEAGPTVEIRAQTQLSLGRVKKRDGGQVEVTGQLQDKLTGEGIPGQKVAVNIAGQQAEAVTQADGSFVATLPAEDGQQEVMLSYEGASRLERAATLTVRTDPAKSLLELAIAKVADDPAGAKLVVNARSDEGPVTVPVRLEVGAVTNDKLAPLRTVDTGTELVLTRKEAGGAGVHRLRAIFAGDDMRQAATATVTLELTSSTTTSMHLSTLKLAFEDELIVSGKVLDDDNRPVAHAAVTLVSGDRRPRRRARPPSKARIDSRSKARSLPGTVRRPSPDRSRQGLHPAQPQQPRDRSGRTTATGAGLVHDRGVPRDRARAAGGFFAARTKPGAAAARPHRPPRCWPRKVRAN